MTLDRASPGPVSRLGHVGLWAGLYCLAAAAWFVQLSGFGAFPTLPLAISILLTSTGAYALDRVKLTSAWIDPADLAAQPARYAFLVPRARTVRTFAVASLIAGAAVGFTIHPLAPLAALLAALGVIIYAARPRALRPRPKDIAWIKNAYVGLGITGFVTLALLADAPRLGMPVALSPLDNAFTRPLLIAAVLLFLRVVIDAALCDIDDEHADRLHGTQTLSTHVGTRRAWLYTGLARGSLIALTLVARPLPWPPRLAWSLAMLAGTLALRVRRPDRVRDHVDLRFAVEAACVTAALYAISPR